MNITPLAIPDVLLIEPRVFGDERGFFYESFNQRAFTQGTGVTLPFVQDNHSKSARGVLRGLHYQVQNPQGKLVRVTAGEVFDVAVDIRRDSPTLANGSASCSRPTTSASCGCPPVWRMGLWCCPRRLSFCTKPPTTTHQSMNAALPGTTPRWPSLGLRWASRPGCQPRTSPP